MIYTIILINMSDAQYFKIIFNYSWKISGDN